MLVFSFIQPLGIPLFVWGCILFVLFMLCSYYVLFLFLHVFSHRGWLTMHISSHVTVDCSKNFPAFVPIDVATYMGSLTTQEGL